MLSSPRPSLNPSWCAEITGEHTAIVLQALDNSNREDLSTQGEMHTSDDQRCQSLRHLPRDAPSHYVGGVIGGESQPYFLTTYPFLHRLARRAIDSVRGLAPSIRGRFPPTAVLSSRSAASRSAVLARPCPSGPRDAAK